MSRLFVVILKCFKLLDMSYLPIQHFTSFISVLLVLCFPLKNPLHFPMQKC